jgi:hypothetical protein
MHVPTWLPCRLQFYCNGHNWLATQLRKHQIPLTSRTMPFSTSATGNRRNAWPTVGRPSRFTTSWTSSPKRFCPIFRHFRQPYHRSLDQAEYATDIVFRRQADLAAI